MAAATDWQKGVAKEVILEFARQGIERFDQHEYTITARRIARKNGAVYGSVSMHVRHIKPLVENGFDNKIKKAKKEIANSKPFVVTPRMRSEAKVLAHQDHLSDP